MSGPLERATQDLRRTPPEPPTGLVDGVMRRVRAEARPGRMVPMPCASGSALVSEAAVREALTRVLDDDGAVVVDRCRVELDAAGALDVELTVRARWESFDVTSPDQVRARVGGALRELFGLAVAAVDVVVSDVVVRQEEER